MKIFNNGADLQLIVPRYGIPEWSGSTLLPAKVTSRIAQGVLAADRSAPCGVTTCNTNLVDVVAS